MKTLIEMFGETRAYSLTEKLREEHPRMHNDWYVRQILKKGLNTY